MDFNTLKNQVQSITLNDIKKGVRSVQNVVMNLTDTESKVREATTNDPWGASSNLMREIADVSHYTEDRIQVMNMIDRRFHEKGPQEWRQIYKSLQLLDFLIRNGDQEVVNAALETHRMRMLKVMKQSFHALDIEGKDVGQNVRILAGNILTLLQDTSSIREARRDAAKSRSKYTGVSSDSYNSKPSRYSNNGTSSGSALGARSNPSDRFGAAALGHHIRGDGGIYGRRTTDGDYDEADDEPSSSNGPQNGGSLSRSTSKATTTPKAPAKMTAKPVPAPAAAPLVDLLDLGFDEPAIASSIPPKVSKPSASSALAGFDDDEDDFDDFQTAPAPAPLQTSQPSLSSNFPAPIAATKLNNSASLLGPKASNAAPLPSNFNFAAPITSNVMNNSTLPARSTSVFPMMGTPSTSTYSPKPVSIISPNPSSKPTSSMLGVGATSNTATKPKGGDAFSDLLNHAGFKKPTTPLGNIGVKKGGQQSLAEMNKKQLDDKLWGASPAPVQSVGNANTRSSNTDSLIDLF